LPLCIIDTVFARGVRYGVVRKIIARYCAFAQIPRIRPDRTTLPARPDQESVSTFGARLSRLGTSDAIAGMFGSRQRTSTQHGILKAEAVLRFADALSTRDIEYLQDMVDMSANRERAVRAGIASIPGQRTAWEYFHMSAGSDDQIIATRMVQRFASEAVGRELAPEQARDLVYESLGLIRAKFPHVTGRLLDHTIWNYQRSANAS
jgi:hypothetical protein